jgi:D-3-phosphoglycerate dehydrogenase
MSISDKRVAVANITFSSNPDLKKRLEQYFPNSIYNENKTRLGNEELARFIDNAEIVVLGLEILNEDILAKNPCLKVIAKYGVGIDNVDFGLLSRHGIELLHEHGVNRVEVAEFAFAQILNLLRNISLTGKLLAKGIWLKDGGVSLNEVTVGVIGVGNIGGAVIEMLSLNGCGKIICYDIDTAKYKQVAHLPNVSFVALEEVLQQSDIISLHIPGDPGNDNFIDRQKVQQMKKGVKLLNISRGSLVETETLLEGIAEGIIHSAALDVYKYEPFFDARIVNNVRIIVTPHTAGNSCASVGKMGASVINNLINFYKLS